MQRRDFLKNAVAVAVAAEFAIGKAQAKVPAHNWGSYDFGSGPQVTDRLNQGPFPQYPPDAVIPTDDVVMTTTSSDDVVPNYGKGLVTYITADSGTEEIKSDNISQAIEDLVRFPLGQQLYIRPTWREVQPRPGRLELPSYLKLVFELAQKNNKRVGLRIQMCAPDYKHEAALPDFVLEKVPKVDLVAPGDQESISAGKRFLENPHSRYQPRYDDPFFQQAFKDLVGHLAAEFDGNPLVEYIDTFMYGFWGEGHTWPFANNPFPDYQTAERTWMNCSKSSSNTSRELLCLRTHNRISAGLVTRNCWTARSAATIGFAATPSLSKTNRLKHSAIARPGSPHYSSRDFPGNLLIRTPHRKAYLRQRT